MNDQCRQAAEHFSRCEFEDTARLYEAVLSSFVGPFEFNNIDDKLKIVGYNLVVAYDKLVGNFQNLAQNEPSRRVLRSFEIIA